MLVAGGTSSACHDRYAELHEELKCRPDREVDQMPGKARRTTHRSSAGKKLYAVRDKKGRFKDIQTYKRAQGSDIKRQSKSEK